MSNPRVYKIRQRAKLTRRLFGTFSRSTAFLVLFFIVLATALYSGSSASSSRATSRSRRPESVARGEDKFVKGSNNTLQVAAGQPSLAANLSMPTLLPLDPIPETVTTYAANCTTPKSNFNFGDTVCAKVEGGPPLAVAPRRLSWVSPDNNIQGLTNVTALGDAYTFTIPARDANDYREVWRVNSITPRYVARASAFFTVSDPANAIASLTVYDSANFDTSKVVAGSELEYLIYVVNRGPDDAQDVVLTNVGTNSSYVDNSAEVQGAGFTCEGAAGGVTCEIDTLPAGTKTLIRVRYETDGGDPVGTIFTNTATVASPTNDPRDSDDTSTVKAVVAVEGVEDACTLICPGDITLAANATQGGNRGAIVKFDVEASGDCGAVSATPASGTFFVVGTTAVQVSGGGDTCSFNVIVTDTGAPDIICAATVTKESADGCPVEVTAEELGETTATGGSGDLTIDADRSDGESLNARFPAGNTTITWKVTDEVGRTDSCTQLVTVNGNDTTLPTVSAPPNVTDFTGAVGASCGKIVGETELGTATGEDSCSSDVTIIRTGVPLGNFFPVGTTTITYRAKDKAGNLSAPATQTVTISDNTPPRIKAPADESYTCPSEVPAANPALATRGDVFDENGDPLPPGPPSDNCSGTPTVAVVDTSTGAGSASSPLVITRTYTATDAVGNTASDVQTITVIDNTLPTIAAPADVVINTGAGATSCGITISDLDAALGAGSASDNCSGATVVRSGVPANNIFPVGETMISYTAVDAAGNSSAPVNQKVTVVDNTLPTISTPADVTLYTGAGATSCGVTVGNLDTALGTATASDNCSGVTVARGNVPAGNTFPLGETIVSYTATDAHGNSSAPVTQKVTVVDNTPPTVTPPANITVQLPLNSSATSMAVSYPNPATATDNCAGAITYSYSPASGSTFNVGTTTVTVTATDAHNNSASATFTVTVLYNFTGFFSPVGNLPTLNSVNAGRAIPVKFSLSGNKGLGIFAANNPYTVGINCNTNDPLVDVTETSSAGGSSLSYGGDQYHYTWKTESSWANTCRQLVVTLNDGSEHRANFKFK